MKIRLGTRDKRPYAPAVIADGTFVFVSGQIPTRDGEILKGSIGEQTRTVLDNIAAILDSAGASLEDIVRCGVLLAGLHDLSIFNTVHAGEFGRRLPARTAVGAALPGVWSRDRLHCSYTARMTDATLNQVSAGR